MRGSNIPLRVTFLLKRGAPLLPADLGDDGLVLHGRRGGGGPPRRGPRGGRRGGGRRRRGAAGAGAAPRRKLCYNMEFPPPGLGLQTWIPGAVSRNPLKGQRRLGALLPLPPPPSSSRHTAPPGRSWGPRRAATGTETGSILWFGWEGHPPCSMLAVQASPTACRALPHSPAPTERAWRKGSVL